MNKAINAVFMTIAPPLKVPNYPRANHKTPKLSYWAHFSINLVYEELIYILLESRSHSLSIAMFEKSIRPTSSSNQCLNDQRFNQNFVFLTIKRAWRWSEIDWIECSSKIDAFDYEGLKLNYTFCWLQWPSWAL